MFTKNWKCVVVSTTIALLAFSGVASAGTIATPIDEAVPYGSIASWGPTVNAVDNVLVGLTPTASTGLWPDYEPGFGNALGVEALTDSLNSPTAVTGFAPNYAYPFTYAGIVTGNSKTRVDNTVTYTLAAATQLDRIVVYGGHAADSVDSFGVCLNRQNFTVEGSSDGGATWTTIGGIDYIPAIMEVAGTNGPKSIIVETTFIDDGLGDAVLGLGGATFDTLKFVFGPSGNDYYGCGYLEVAAYKTADVPEPSALILLACAFAGLLAYAWRKRR